MRLQSGNLIRLAATDLSNHLAAASHFPRLEVSRSVCAQPPEWRSPDLVIIQERGKRHEAA